MLMLRGRFFLGGWGAPCFVIFILSSPSRIGKKKKKRFARVIERGLRSKTSILAALFGDVTSSQVDAHKQLSYNGKKLRQAVGKERK